MKITLKRRIGANINVKLRRDVQEKRVTSSLSNVAPPIVKVRSCLLFALSTVEVKSGGWIVGSNGYDDEKNAKSA